jgi:RNA-directed DNA polymerase
VFDLRTEVWRRKVAKGDVIVVRYADDLVVGFEHRAEAERFLEAFRERLSKFGLELNSEKTRLIEFGRFAAQKREQRGEGKPETFTFLGFTHYCGKLRSGTFTVGRETAKKRMVAKLQSIRLELRRRRHEPIARVGEWLGKVCSGYYLYHAVPGNLGRLNVFRTRLGRLWRLVPERRSQRSRVSWERMNQLLARWVPVPRVMHPHPRERFDATHPRWKPYA